MGIRIHKKKAKKLAAIIDVALLAILIVSAVALAVTLIRYGKNKARYRAAAEAVSQLSVTPAPSDATLFTPVPAESPARPRETPPIQVDFEALKQETLNVVGWIYSEGTPINYPVMLGRNNEYYLTHAYNGDKDQGGSIFCDCRMSRALAEQNLILYGHHMKNDAMFGSLMRYQKQAYYEEHPFLYLITPERSYKILVFAARPTTSDPKLYPLWFESTAARDNFVREAISESTIRTEVKGREGAQIVSLVTCSYYGADDAKFQVHGYLVPLE